jgi:hypothetical protein
MKKLHLKNIEEADLILKSRIRRVWTLSASKRLHFLHSFTFGSIFKEKLTSFDMNFLINSKNN